VLAFAAAAPVSNARHASALGFRFAPAERIMSPVTELFDHIDQLRHASGRIALATLVSTRGTTPRKEGAKMVVDDRGSVLGSVTIGGCVDAQVIQESTGVLETMRPRLLELDLGDEEAWEIGLTCGGTIEVFVEPLALDRADDEAAHLWDRLRAYASGGGRGALVTRLGDSDAGDADARAAGDPDRTAGRTDRGPGGKLLVLDDGTTEGTLGNAAVDVELGAEARDAMADGASRVVSRAGVRAFIDVVAPPALLLIVGAGHVAMPLTSLARVLGYRTVVIDGRPRFATPERFPDVDELRIGIPSDLVKDYRLVRSAALVLVAHDYKYDIPVLHHALGTDVGYIGMLGSSRRGATILSLLAEDGVSEDALSRVRVPIGLDIGARTAPEIALAVLAEIQQARGGGTGRPLREIRRVAPSPTQREDESGSPGHAARSESAERSPEQPGRAR
jgi:xanthine dehydrogenase accessory factor